MVHPADGLASGRRPYIGTGGRLRSASARSRTSAARGADRPVRPAQPAAARAGAPDPKASGMSRSEEHTSELQSLMRISYAVFCLKKKNIQPIQTANLTSHNLNTNNEL